jgi:hypothetical protein
MIVLCNIFDLRCWTPGRYRYVLLLATGINGFCKGVDSFDSEDIGREHQLTHRLASRELATASFRFGYHVSADLAG